MSTKQNAPVEKVVVAPELLERVKAEASAWKAMTSRHEKQEAARTPGVARVTFDAFESGMVGTGRKRPEGQESQAAYAARFGVNSGSVTRWRRLGRALALGMDPESPEWKVLQRTVNDARVNADEASLEEMVATIHDIATITDAGTINVKPAPKPEAAAPASEKEAPETSTLVLSAANVVEVVGLLSAQIVAQWDAWNLKPETAGALLESLEGITSFVGEKRPTSKSARSKRTA